MSGIILETSTERSAIVLASKGQVVAFRYLLGGPELSKTLALEVDLLLKMHAFTPRFIAVGIGPGSYTGTRVGVALAKGLGFGWNIPLFGYCSLRAFAPPQLSFCPVLVDAKIGGIYVLKEELASPRLLSIAQAETELYTACFLSSPHPDILKKRLALPGRWIESAPNLQALASLADSLFFANNIQPLTLSYLTPMLN